MFTQLGNPSGISAPPKSLPFILLRTSLHEYQNKRLILEFLRFLTPFFSHSCALRHSQTLSFDILAINTGGGGCIGQSSQELPSIASHKEHELPRSFAASNSSNSFTSYPFRTLFTLHTHRTRRNPFSFFSLRTLAKTMGGGGGISAQGARAVRTEGLICAEARLAASQPPPRAFTSCTEVTRRCP
jgi:hypothetical protein